MLNFLFRRNTGSNVPQQLYGEVVTQSRLPSFYTDYGFEDSVMGRFDVLSLHMFLLSHRLGLEQEEKAMSLAQEIFDSYTDSIDDALRALGIGDTSVPKKKKKMVRSFYGQIEDFRQPLMDKDKPALQEQVAIRFFDGENTETTGRLVDYMLATTDHLKSKPLETYYRSKLTWLDPGKVKNR